MRDNGTFVFPIHVACHTHARAPRKRLPHHRNNGIERLAPHHQGMPHREGAHALQIVRNAPQKFITYPKLAVFSYRSDHADPMTHTFLKSGRYISSFSAIRSSLRNIFSRNSTGAFSITQSGCCSFPSPISTTAADASASATSVRVITSFRPKISGFPR